MELTLDRLTKHFGASIAVDRVSATFTPGVYGLLGANGAGKTTLMRMLCDVLKPTSGSVLCDGMDIVRLGADYRAHLGYLPQEFGYYPDFTALDFMLYLASLKGIGRHEARRRSLDLLETVDLAPVAKRKIKTFSGGMKQRLGIAQAVLNDPAILVLDEPTAGLDPKERVRFRNLIASFAQNKVVILSMRAGSFVLEGSPEQVVAQVAGKVWECAVDRREADALAARGGVGNVHYGEGAQVVLRIVSDEKPHPAARPLEPTLEDVYLYLFRESSSSPTRRAHAQTGAGTRGKGGRHA